MIELVNWRKLCSKDVATHAGGASIHYAYPLIDSERCWVEPSKLTKQDVIVTQDEKIYYLFQFFFCCLVLCTCTYPDHLYVLSLNSEMERGLLVVVLNICTGTLHT